MRKTNVHHDRCRPDCSLNSVTGSVPFAAEQPPSPLFGGRQSAALLDWSSWGAQRLGKTATLVPSRWSCLRHRG